MDEFRQEPKPTAGPAHVITRDEMLAKYPWVSPAMKAAAMARLQLMNDPSRRNAGGKDLGWAETYEYPANPHVGYFKESVDPETRRVSVDLTPEAIALSESDPEQFDRYVAETKDWSRRMDSPEFVMKPMTEKEAHEGNWKWYPSTEQYIRALSANNPELREDILRELANEHLREALVSDLRENPDSPKYDYFLRNLMDLGEDEGFTAEDAPAVENRLSAKGRDVGFDSQNPYLQLAGDAIIPMVNSQWKDPELWYKTSKGEVLGRAAGDAAITAATGLAAPRIAGSTALRLGGLKTLSRHPDAAAALSHMAGGAGAGAANYLLTQGGHGISDDITGGGGGTPFDLRDLALSAGLGVVAEGIPYGVMRGDPRVANALGIRRRMSNANPEEVTMRDIKDSFKVLSPKKPQPIDETVAAGAPLPRDEARQAMSVRPSESTPMKRSDKNAAEEFMMLPFGDFGERVQRHYGEGVKQANRVEMMPELKYAKPNSRSEIPAKNEAILEIPGNENRLVEEMVEREDSPYFGAARAQGENSYTMAVPHTLQRTVPKEHSFNIETVEDRMVPVSGYYDTGKLGTAYVSEPGEWTHVPIPEVYDPLTGEVLRNGALMPIYPGNRWTTRPYRISEKFEDMVPQKVRTLKTVKRTIPTRENYTAYEIRNLFPDASDPQFLQGYVSANKGYFEGMDKEGLKGLGTLARQAQAKDAAERKYFSGKEVVMPSDEWRANVASFKGNTQSPDINANLKNATLLELFRHKSEPGVIRNGKFEGLEPGLLNDWRARKDESIRRGGMNLVAKHNLRDVRGTESPVKTLGYWGATAAVPGLAQFGSGKIPNYTEIYGDKTQGTRYTEPRPKKPKTEGDAR